MDTYDIEFEASLPTMISNLETEIQKKQYKKAKAQIAQDKIKTFERVKLSDVKMEKIDWLWKGRLAKRMICQFQGAPGKGKSQVTIYIASVISNGWTFIDGQKTEQGSVLFITSEDGVANTIKPRVVAAGGNVDKIEILNLLTTEDGKKEVLDLSKHLEELRKTVKEMPDLKLIVIDPITAFLGDVDANSNSEVRGLLTGFQEILNEVGCAAIMLTHNNKSSGQSALARASGSIAFGAVSRMAFIFGTNPENEESFIMSTLKGNTTVPPKSLAYTIVGEELIQDGEVIETSRVKWLEDDVSHINAQEVANYLPNKQVEKGVGRPDDKFQQCVDHLKLSVGGRAVNKVVNYEGIMEIKKIMNDSGYTDAMVKKARDFLGIEASGGAITEWKSI